MVRRKNGVLVVGHRGAMGHAPENTRAAFEAGLRLGVGAVECDVQLSKDGRLVVIHDATLDRTTNGHGTVRRTVWAALHRLDAGTWFDRSFAGENVWCLDDLLRWAKRQRTRAGGALQVVVELKTQPSTSKIIVTRTVAVLKKWGMVKRAFLISFDHGAVARAKALLPTLRTGLLLNVIPPHLSQRMSSSRATAVFPRFTLVTDLLMREAQRRGWFVGTWTVNGRSDMRKLIRLGVHAIASNYPERLVRLLHDR